MVIKVSQHTQVKLIILDKYRTHAFMDKYRFKVFILYKGKRRLCK